MLKLKFDANQNYQKDAIDSIVKIFDGQDIKHSVFTNLEEDRGLVGKYTELGYGNKIDLIDEDLLNNTIKIQNENSLERSSKLIDEQYGVPNFAIEMETGTGKTYVYTRTILELNAKYGLSKFVIVVPSLAIREGVYKSLSLTESHFKELYPGQAFNYFIYNSDRLTSLRSFASSEIIEIMIINIDAFRKGFEEGKEDKATRIHKPSDKLNGRKPIEFIQQTNPIVIIDEPQSVDNTPKAKEAIKALNPLCIFRYSATHRDSYNLMYKLGPIEACEQNLVKKIEVLSVTGSSNNDSQIKLLSTSYRNNAYSAKLQLKVLDKKGKTSSKSVTVNTHKKNNLYTLSGENDLYKDKFVTNISTQKDNEYIEINETEIIKIGQTEDDLVSKRAQIRWTIETHLERELNLLPKGIKVLSLFFIDKVANYRESSEGEKGIYAQIFEEEYLRLISLPKFNSLFHDDKHKKYALNESVTEVHEGYFAQDNKGKYKDSKGNTKADESTYELIMKNKEKLLSFDTPLRFIFSHTALKEGWDNPNVFQICTLVENQDNMTKRQKVGRGLRLPVNQSGDRIYDEHINILTVVANESYESFADSLQKEIEEDTNTRFGIVTKRLFEKILVDKDGVKQEFGFEASQKLYEYLEEKELINKKGKLSPGLKDALISEDLDLPEEFQDIKKEIIEEIKKTQKRLPILNPNNRQKIRLKKEVLLSPEFSELWDRIKHKTIFRLDFDNEVLINNSIKALSEMQEIKTNPVIGRWVDLQIDKRGISASDPKRVRDLVREEYENKRLPNILQYLEKYTRLKKSTLAKILIDSKSLTYFYLNPQEYMQTVAEIINSEKRKVMVEGIKYERIGDHEFYSQELFEDDELIGYLKENSVPVSKSVYSHIVYDSGVEETFAKRLDQDEDVKLFAKLPSWFKIETPLGGYNPDWAVLMENNGEEKLYFVVETKGSTVENERKGFENAKILCGKKHFEALDSGAIFEDASDYDEWRNKQMKLVSRV